MKLLIGLLVFLLALAFPSKTLAADVVINEVFPNPSGASSEDTEFIELYNKTASPISITDWKLSDNAKNYTIPESTIPANGFVSFRKDITGIGLNNSGGEDVFLKDNLDQLIDSMHYDTTADDKSWSRIPDGTGSFVNNTEPTEGSHNAEPPTPTPTDTPTPTKTPTPKKIPTPTKTPTPTLTSKSTSAQTTTAEQRDNPTLGVASEKNNNSILGESSNVSESPTEAPETEVLGQTRSKSPFVFMGLGLIFLAVCGILAYLQFGDKIIPWKKRSL